MRDIVDRRYRVEHKLAAGGFGAIYRATDLQVGRPVALKVLHRELAHDASVVARFRREAAALARLKSPHTLTLYDVGESDDTLYLVMELLRGESLQELFDRGGPLPWSRVARVARGVCNSLREAHEQGIVHRDLKPANIFLEQHALEGDFVKVLDFGIAKVLDGSELDHQDLTHVGQMIGTFDYMAPEQMVGGMTTAASDVFTLGVVLYEMITGYRPYGDAKGPATMLMQLLSTVPAPLSGIPAELADIIMRCISREPWDRPGVVELDEVLAHVLEIDRPGDGDLDLDGPTVVEPLAPLPVRVHVDAGRAKRTTLPRGSAQPLHVGGELARESAPRVRQVLVAPLIPVVHAPEPLPAPRTRLASGTSPIVNEPAARSVVVLRWLLVGVSLVGLGFAGALVGGSL